MNRKIVKTIALETFVLVVVLSAPWQTRAQDTKAPYPSMAPLDQYLMERNAEIAMARSAAPESISRDCRRLGPRTARLRNCRQRQERFRVCRGTIVDGPIRPPGVLESQDAGSALLQSSGRSVDPTTHFQKDRIGIGGAVQSSDHRRYQDIR